MSLPLNQADPLSEPIEPSNRSTQNQCMDLYNYFSCLAKPDYGRSSIQLLPPTFNDRWIDASRNENGVHVELTSPCISPIMEPSPHAPLKPRGCDTSFHKNENENEDEHYHHHCNGLTIRFFVPCQSQFSTHHSIHSEIAPKSASVDQGSR